MFLYIYVYIYYSTLAPFYHIRSRERAKYATVLHSKIMYCTAKSRFHRFCGQRTEKNKFDLIFLNGIINLLLDGLTYNTRGHFAHCSHFKNTTQLAKYPRALYAKPSNKMYLLFNCCQQSTNNTQNEYKYPSVFVLQKTCLTGFLQMTRQALGLRGK